MTIEEIIQCAEKGETFHVPPELMPDYIRWLYTTHRCVHDFLRVRVESVSRGDIVLSMPVTADYTNSGGFLYGGILAALADAMSLGLIVSVGKSAVTTNLSMNFVRAHPIEGQLRLHGQLRHNGGRMLTLRGEIFGHRGGTSGGYGHHHDRRGPPAGGAGVLVMESRGALRGGGFPVMRLLLTGI